MDSHGSLDLLPDTRGCTTSPRPQLWVAQDPQADGESLFWQHTTLYVRETGSAPLQTHTPVLGMNRAAARLN